MPVSFGKSDSRLSITGLGTWISALRSARWSIRDKTATFNVGGGIVIDSDPESEYEETLTKAEALLNAIGGKLDF